MLGACALSAVAAAGCTHGETEVCDGIDDNGNGLVDEGCACQPFSVEVPFRVTSALSLGDGWALTTTDLSETATFLAAVSDPSASQVQMGYARIDGSGAVRINLPALDGLFGPNPRPFAWTGTELAYLWAGASAEHIATMTPDGVPVVTGPDLGIDHPAGSPVPPSSAMIQATKTGFDLTLRAFTSYPYSYFVSTDASGTSVRSSLLGASTSWATALGEINGTSVVAWFAHLSPGDGDAFTVGVMPDSASHPDNGPGRAQLADSDVPSLLATNGASASNGHEIILLGGPQSTSDYSFDGTTVSVLRTGGRAIAWAGDHYEIARESDTGLLQVQVAPDNTITLEQWVAPTLGYQLLDAVVAADASHVLYGQFIEGTGGNYQVLTQVCL